MHKRDLRKTVLARRDSLTPAEIEAKSAAIAARLYTLPAYREAGSVLFFISFGSEVDTRPPLEETINRGKLALAPKTVPQEKKLVVSRILDWDRDLAPGFRGIPEPAAGSLRPVDPGLVELVIVPGVAFDHRRNRLGYGGGYYDRFFDLLAPGTPLVALAFELQILPEVPTDEWDRRVDWIVTEKRLIGTESP